MFNSELHTAEEGISELEDSSKKYKMKHREQKIRKCQWEAKKQRGYIGKVIHIYNWNNTRKGEREWGRNNIYNGWEFSRNKKYQTTDSRSVADSRQDTQINP